MADTILIDGVDVQTVADIMDLSGILSTGPYRADLIVRDWEPGAVAQIGPPDAYTMDLPLLMKSDDPATALGQLRTVQGWAGRILTVTRVITVGATVVTETCQACIVSATAVDWLFDARNLIGCVLMIQNLDGGWTPSP
jgi:hypothetical protein